MADNVTTATGAPATLPSGTTIAARAVLYSGDTALVAPVGLVAFSGSDDAKTAIDITGDGSNGLDVDVTRVQGTVAVTQSGTWNVATVTTITTVASVTALPARTRTVDAIASAQQTDALMNGLTVLTPKFANVGVSTATTTAVVAAVTSKKIRVLSVTVATTTTAQTFNLQDGAATALLGNGTQKIGIAINDRFTLPYNPLGWCETAAGSALNMVTSAAATTTITVTYVEV